MANASKSKGDRFEREAMAMLEASCPDLLVPGATRGKNAGQPLDRGDLFAFEDVSVQVRAYAMNRMGQALRSAAADSLVQAGNAHRELGVGLCPIPRAPKSGVRWVVSMAPEMAQVLSVDPVAEFSQVSRLLPWLRDDDGPHGYLTYDRTVRWGLLTPDVVVGPVEAFLLSYRALRPARECLSA